MALLTLKDIGKIYVSDGNVAVGIRGVNLSFDRGEFVAVTGKSGSGKSTLLNVVSGMDSYEEGEMLIEGKPTSHFLQPEWEEYRKQYISFIFQDYNIIESFTVLQNVELALMHIEDKKERRKRALDLLDRVGLSSHLHHKGSKLSGGQKQRTVIARALAKDSPIILADEPTGNLDSATSAEIIQLLREVSRDKLLIVVTHNFEQVEEYATRHIRVFDGSIEFDHTIREREVDEGVSFSTVKSEDEDNSKEKASKKKVKKKGVDTRNGLVLGRTIFTSKPKLSAFLCLLLAVGALGIFFMTSLCGEAADIFDKHYMFEPIEGRVIFTRQNGATVSADDAKAIAEEYGAQGHLPYDILLDNRSFLILTQSQKNGAFNFSYDEELDGLIGTVPTKSDEVMLSLPLSYKKDMGEDPANFGYASFESLSLKITGISYYVDNNLAPKCVFTKEGFRAATAVYYIGSQSSANVSFTATTDDGSNQFFRDFYNIVPSYEVEEGKIYIYDSSCRQAANIPNATVGISFHANYYNYDWHTVGERNVNFRRTLGLEHLSSTGPDLNSIEGYRDYSESNTVAIHPTLLMDIVETVLSDSYRQASLFYPDDRAAADAAELMNNNGYIAVTSDTTYTPNASQLVATLLSSLMMALLWIVAIVFLAFFVNLCSSRTIGAFKGDMAIMRSMGIPVKVIRISMYVRMLIALIPSFLLVIAAAITVFTVPVLNGFFGYLYLWQYVAIFGGLLLLTIRITHKQIKKLFGESVKKSLKGGNAND